MWVCLTGERSINQAFSRPSGFQRQLCDYSHAPWSLATARSCGSAFCSERSAGVMQQQSLSLINGCLSCVLLCSICDLSIRSWAPVATNPGIVALDLTLLHLGSVEESNVNYETITARIWAAASLPARRRSTAGPAAAFARKFSIPGHVSCVTTVVEVFAVIACDISRSRIRRSMARLLDI